MSKPILTLPCKYTLSDFEQKDGLHHCQSCSHSLRDFRNSTDEEIRQELSDKTTKSCGIFNPSQVSAKSTTFQLGLQRRVGLSLLGILGFMGTAMLTGCDDMLPPDQDPQTPEAIKEQQAFSKLKFPMKLKGKLVDKTTKQPVANAKIRLMQRGAIVLTGKTNAEGDFAITISQSQLTSTHFDLILDKMGFVSDTVRQLKAGTQTNLQLTIEAKCDDNCIPVPGQMEVRQPEVGELAAPVQFIPPVTADSGSVQLDVTDSPFTGFSVYEEE